MHDLKDWLPLLIMLAGLAVTYGRLNERLVALGELMRRLESKEDTRSERERAGEGRIAQLESSLKACIAEVAKLRDCVDGQSADIARISGKMTREPK